MSTLPRLILAGTDVPTYLVRTAADDATLRRYVPSLPAESGMHWATVVDDATPAHELTVPVVAELLLISGTDPDGDPAELAAAVDRALGLARCNLTLVAAIAEAYLAEHWECAQRQLDRYTLAAGRLTGTEV